TLAWPSAALRSSVTERLLRDCTCHHSEVPSLSLRHLRSGSPTFGGSILITSAPNSPSSLLAKGPAISWPISTTLRPCSGRLFSVCWLIATPVRDGSWRRA